MTFYKYPGTGNDFILIDDRANEVELTTQQIADLCHRRFGIGADGLMLLRHADGYDFRMVYYNSDGRESSMCGNGGRCLVAFAHSLGLVTTHASFIATDGPHTATIAPDGLISLHMKDVADVQINKEYTFLDTGSPHYILWVEDAQAADVFNEGKRIRYSDAFKPGGTNVNFVQQTKTGLHVRTYERGVEDETLSCGTGVTAAAIAATCTATGTFKTNITTPGGQLAVAFTKNTPASAVDVVLTGPAVFVFKGEADIDRLAH